MLGGLLAEHSLVLDLNDVLELDVVQDEEDRGEDSQASGRDLDGRLVVVLAAAVVVRLLVFVARGH